MSRLISFCLAVIMLLFLVNTPMAMADTSSQLKEKIKQDIKNQQDTLGDLRDKEDELNGTEDTQSSIESKVKKLESQIEDYNYQIQVKQNRVEEKQKQIQTLKENIKDLQKRIDQREKLIADRARSTYVNGGPMRYFQILLGSKNFSDLVSRAYFVSKIAEHDQTTLKNQLKDKKEMDKNQKALKVTLNQLDSDLQKLNQFKQSLKDKKAHEQALLKQLKEKANQIKATISVKQKQATHYKQLEEAHKAELRAWESKLLQNTNIPQEIRQFVAPAQKLDQTGNIPAAITIAQIILESGGNISTLAREGKNLFGIKGEGPAGTIYLATHEVIGGQEITIKAGFKKYGTYYQSMVDHAKILQLSRYQYFLANAQNLNEFAYGIQDGGYSTDPNYANKLLTIIKDYGLSKYDIGSF